MSNEQDAGAPFIREHRQMDGTTLYLVYVRKDYEQPVSDNTIWHSVERFTHRDDAEGWARGYHAGRSTATLPADYDEEEPEFDGPSCERCGVQPAASCECDA